jgi:hypothetical protein
MQMELFEEQFTPIKSTDWKWTMANDYPPSNGIKVFSCFACGGGSTMGYKLAGCEVLGCCEIDPKMNELYVANHHPKYNYCEDIREFNKRDDLPPELYDLDILDGSPPCTTFSMAGDREDSWGKKKKFREGQAEQTLDEYKESLEGKIESLCSDVSGVGKCRVFITFERGVQNSYKGSTVTETKPPKVLGVTVICKGGEIDSVKKAISDMICALFDIGYNRVAVLQLNS